MKLSKSLRLTIITLGIFSVIFSVTHAQPYRDGVYEGVSPKSVWGAVWLKVLIENRKIKDIQYLEIPDWQPEEVKKTMRERIVREQSPQVDAVTGAKDSSKLISQAVAAALEKASEPSRARSETPSEKVSDPPPPRVILETTRGRIELLLYPEKAPKTVENFIGLVKKGYYDGIIFHRVIPGFMIQGGDPTGTGRGGASLWGKPFKDEFSPGLQFDKPGLLAMANSGPGTNGSQFFITVASTPWLNNRHTIFGEVVAGYDVVTAIERTPTGPDARPKDEQKILKAELIQR
ncbi:MAG: peptidylprolyl isomerase [Candidatus Euphemobacter frigidus]|nr:peptidylprolyl isomerase [Candidatus Euphemobacter frigidus]